MKKPIILITSGPAIDSQFHRESQTLNKTYVAAVAAADGIPVLWNDVDRVEEYVALADGCICTGTVQYSPPDYSVDFLPRQKERIHKEHILMHAFMEAGKPILGICQGMQQLNTALGGTLHIDFRLECGVEHNRTSHMVETVPGTWINSLYGSSFLTNSLHNVKVKELAPGLKISAVSPDGVIEAFEHESLPTYGFQWHPERMRGDFPDPPHGLNMEKVFHEFVKLCKNKGGKEIYE